MSIRIVNLRNYCPIEDEILIKVDRSSPVGNPFFMKHEGMRDEVCYKYQKHFDEKIVDSYTSEFNKYIGEIIQTAHTSNVALGCWCYPKRCHAETIKKFIEESLREA